MAEYADYSGPKKTEDITIEEAKDFLSAAMKERANWYTCAQHSWNEIKKIRKNGTLWSVAPNSARKSVRYPLWNSTFQIRKPLVLSRAPTPIGRDTGGSDDAVGLTAAILLERLANSILKTFPFLEVLESARDDMLVTNIGQVRAYYEMEETQIPERDYLQQSEPDPKTGAVSYFYSDGEPLKGDEEILEDESGLYVLTGRDVAIQNEKVCLKPVLYRDLYVDACAYRWGDVYELAFACDYSVQQFKKIFGKDALLAIGSEKEAGQKQRKSIRVFEYWNFAKKKVGWFTEAGEDFIAKKVMTSDGEVTAKTMDDLYGLEKFFPCPKPMVFNAPTDSFWPVCEWYQLNDLLEEIHTIASRIFVLARAIRIRALFDNNVQGLQSLVNEVSEADWIGVANLLSQIPEGKDITSIVAYLPIQPMVEGLTNMYQALEQRLAKFEQLTGTGDLLQGETEANTGKTLGERQMEGKYATSRIYPMQEDMQRFAAESLELLTEMALKNFSDASLEEYIVPQTLDDDHQQNYQAAIELLKNDRKRRFRIELETDSTIAINEEYDKQMRMQIVDTLTKSIEATAEVLQSTPQLAKPMLMLQSHLAGGFRQGKQFIDEIKQAFEQIIEAQEEAQQNPQPPPPDPKIEADVQMAQMEVQSKERIEFAKLQVEQGKGNLKVMELQLNERMAAADNQIKWLKIQSDASASNAELQAEMQKAIEGIQLAREELTLERDKLMLAADEANQSQSVEVFKLQLESQAQAFDQQMTQLENNLSAWKVQIDEREKLATEARLQREQMMEGERMEQEHQRELVNLSMQAKPAPQAGVSIHLPSPAPSPLVTATRTIKDKKGNMIKQEMKTPLAAATQGILPPGL